MSPETTNIYGIEDTKDVLKLVFRLVDGYSKSKEDGKFTITDAANFLGAVMVIPQAITGINNVPDEIKELNEAEMQELKDFIAEQFDIADDVLEALIEEIIATAIDVGKLVSKLVRYKKDQV